MRFFIRPFNSCTLKGESICSRDIPEVFEASDADALAKVHEQAQRGGEPKPYAFWVPGSAGCVAKLNTYTCEDEFKEYMIGCREEYSREYIVSRCDVSDYRSEKDSIAKVYYDQEPRSRVSRRGECSDQPFPECARPHTRESGTQALGTSAGGCSSALNISAPPESTGLLMDNLCVDFVTTLRDRYRKRTGLSSEASIVVLSTPGEPIFSFQRPSNPCIPAESIGDGDTRRFLCARESSLSRAQRCCDAHRGRCVVEKVSPGTSVPAENSLDLILNSAEERAVDAVQAIYPPAISPNECVNGETSCIGVNAFLEQGNTVARVRAHMTVPLSMLSILGEPEMMVEYEERRVLERAISSETNQNQF